LRGSELGQYTCSNLLRKLEAANSESDDENFMMIDGDEELVKMPNS
jgi:hypothetical protein